MPNDISKPSGRRIVSAFFDTQGAMKQACDDLLAAGVAKTDFAETGGGDAEAEASTGAEIEGFWASLKAFFLPDEDRPFYAEGLRRGGYLLTVRVNADLHDRVLDILDTDGAIDLDEREGQWRSEDGLLQAGAQSMIDTARASGGLVPEPGVTTPLDNQTIGGTASATSHLATAPSGATRDAGLGRSRLRSYTVNEEGPRMPFSPERDAALIVPDMPVISADGQAIGTVDHLDGSNRIALAKSSSPDGLSHDVPFTWIDHVDQHVHLTKTLAEIKAGAS